MKKRILALLLAAIVGIPFGIVPAFIETKAETSEGITIPAEPVLTSTAKYYYCTDGTKPTGAVMGDGSSPLTPLPSSDWGSTTANMGKAMRDGGTFVCVGKGFIPSSVTIPATSSPVLFTAVDGDTVYYDANTMDNAATNGHGTQKGMLFANSNNVVTFMGDVIFDDAFLLDRASVIESSTFAVGSTGKMVICEGTLFGSMRSWGATWTGGAPGKGEFLSHNIKASVAEGGYLYLHALGFESYSGKGTIVVDKALLESGEATAATFAGFEGRIVTEDGTPACEYTQEHFDLIGIVDDEARYVCTSCGNVGEKFSYTLPTLQNKDTYAYWAFTGKDANDGLTPKTPKAGIAAVTAILPNGGNVVITGKGYMSTTISVGTGGTLRFTSVGPDGTSYVGVDYNGNTDAQFGSLLVGTSSKDQTIAYASDVIFSNVIMYSRDAGHKTTYRILNGATALLEDVETRGYPKNNIISVDYGSTVIMTGDNVGTFGAIVGEGTVVLDRALLETGKLTPDLFSGFDGVILDLDCDPVNLNGYESLVWGDTNADAAINNKDITLLVRYLVGQDIGYVSQSRFDLNSDGRVNNRDAIALIQRVADFEGDFNMLDSDTSLQYSNGSWKYTNGTVTANNSTITDSFAMTDIYIPAGTAFEFEAEMTISSGNAGGLVFGVKAPLYPSSYWFCVNVSKTSKNTRLFSVGTGDSAGTHISKTLSSAQLAQNSYLLNVSATENGMITFCLDGVVVGRYQATADISGFIGLNTFQSNAAFKNIKYKVGEYTPSSDNIFTTVNGAWSYGPSSLKGNNATLGDSFAMSNVYVPAKTEFTVEADITFNGGSNTGGIVFGVGNAQSPSSGWYCVNLARDTQKARLFSIKTGSIGDVHANTSKIIESLPFTDTYRMYLNVSADGNITYKIDGELVYSYSESEFAGGYIGFISYKSNILFSNISITVDGKEATLTETKLTSGSDTYYIDLSKTYQYLEVGKDCGTARIENGNGAYTISYSVETDENGAISLEYGKNSIFVDVIDEYARRHTILLEIWRDIPEEQLYSDVYRPSYHVTPPINFMNDPNGLWYDASTGDYHAYYQYDPYGLKIGNQVWGHAVSKDLLNWTDHGIAIGRERDDCIFSGSCVVDRNNTSGLFDESVHPDRRVVAIYTTTAPFKQEIAYSTDGGYTFTKYSGNPVIASSQYYSSFRDPKVQWIEEYGLWLMIVAGGPGEIYTSPDLIHWTSHGIIKDINGTNIESECPMLLALPLDGNENDIKYVYVGSGKFYIVGDLVYENGTMTFVAEQEKISTLFHSNSHYATQDFYNDKEGRTLLMSWIRDNTSAFLLDNKYWHGIQSIPYVTTLVTADGKMKLHLEMPEEIEGICGDALVELSDTVIDAGSTVKTAESKSAVIELKAKLDSGESVTLRMRASDAHYVDLVCSYSSAGKVSVVLDTSKSSDKVIRNKITATVLTDADGYFSLDILLDNCVIEVFTNDGNVLSDFFFTDEDGDDISIFASGQVDIAEYSVFAA